MTPKKLKTRTVSRERHGKLARRFLEWVQSRLA